jgi:hypothetical protein
MLHTTCQMACSAGLSAGAAETDALRPRRARRSLRCV